MKKLPALIILCYLSLPAFAQTPLQTIKVSGRLVDSLTKQPIRYVSVNLIRINTNQSVKTVLSGENGLFDISAATGSSYNLLFTYMGYVPKTIKLDSLKTIIDAGEISLSPLTNQLKEVSITAKKNLIKQDVDRISYDIQADPESRTASVLEIMRKVPLLSVDGDEKIRFKGNGSFRILLNGRTSAMLARNPSDILKAMPAANIQRIEVITTPPSKYEAEGLSGLINIVTKKNTDDGYNIFIGSRYHTYERGSLNTSGTVKHGKFGLYGYIGGGKQTPARGMFNNRQEVFNTNTVLTQSGFDENSGSSITASGELSYEIDTLNLLIATIQFSRNKTGQYIETLSQADSSSLITQQYLQQGKNNTRSATVDLGIDYQLGFKNNKERLLTLSYKYSYSPTEQRGNSLFYNRVNFSRPDFTQYNTAGGKEHTIQVDYVEPFKKVNIEAGGKAILRNNYSDFRIDSLNGITGQYILNKDQSNSFNYYQNVYSLYNSYHLKFNNWAAKVGLRLERTTLNADFISTGTFLNSAYSNLIPSVSVMHNLPGGNINLGYTQRIQRPGIYYLNPFINRINPRFIVTGNPNLRPELNNTIDVSYSNYSNGYIQALINYSFANNAIQSVSVIKTELINNSPDTVTYTTFQNLGTNKSLGFSPGFGRQITKKIYLNLNGQLTRVWLEGYYNGKLYKNSGYSGNAYYNITYKLNNGFSVGSNGGGASGYVTLQGRTAHSVYLNFSVTKELLNKKGTGSFYVINPQSRYWANTSYTHTPDFYQTNVYNRLYRAFVVRMSYKFGKLNSQIKKNRRGIKNDDTKK